MAHRGGQAVPPHPCAQDKDEMISLVSPSPVNLNNSMWERVQPGTHQYDLIVTQVILVSGAIHYCAQELVKWNLRELRTKRSSVRPSHREVRILGLHVI